MAGSFGVTDILKIYENLIQLDDEFQIIVITGRNRKLYDALTSLSTEMRTALKLRTTINILLKANSGK